MNRLLPLPSGCTKKELKAMFPNENHRSLMECVRQIHERRNKSRFKRYLSAGEMAQIFVEFTGVPVGYSGAFKDGESYREKYRKTTANNRESKQYSR